MTDEPDSLILQMLRGMRADMADMRGQMSDMRGEMATKSDLALVREDIGTLRADVAHDIHTLRNELGEQIVGLRRAVVEYHTSVIGHGIIISDLEARVRRVEQHLDLPPLAH